MRFEEISFVCDICGRKISVKKESMALEMSGGVEYPLPSDWRVMVPYGDVCSKCCEELDGVYNRIHAPVKAREEAYADQRQRRCS